MARIIAGVWRTEAKCLWAPPLGRPVEPRRWTPPAGDREVGLGFYASSSPPLAGRIKADAEDFQVQEISSYPVPDPDGRFTVLRVRSRNWEQHELAERIASRLRLPPHALSWAGTKDRRAVSERLFSYPGPVPASGSLDLPEVELLEAYRARDGVSLGHHYGNTFTIRVSDLLEGADEAAVRLEGTAKELRTFGGFPNFFGLQRFGEVRPVTHLVGRELVRGRPDAAVETYLTYLPDSGDSMGAEARANYARDHDAARALREFPAAFQFEKRLLDHLARGHPPERALGALSRELRKLFVHAYQALLFNRWLCARAAAGFALGDPVPGDHLLRVGPDGTVRTVDPIPASEDNLRECRELATRGRAIVAGPLVGFETPPGEGEIGTLFDQILQEEGVTPSDFSLPRTPEVASAGSWRPAIVPMPPVSLAAEKVPSGPPGTPRGVWARFSLPKGSYATVLLREFLKTGAQALPVVSNQPF
ncbi:MAG TPA: tRNA pseudouridine(13) synthase TruD [Thermoplasmata archaeon]|nr:tRNA pseudouridine(13) synthase TruD [Thermoplasmata archaeon]